MTPSKPIPSAAAGVLAVALVSSSVAQAFVVPIADENPRTVYLRVGDGNFQNNRTYADGGNPRPGGAVNTVRVTVSPQDVGTGVFQPMTAGNARVTSDYDGFAFCQPGQLYVGGFYRGRNTVAVDNATLSVNSDISLINGAGDSIPMSQISWTSSGIGDTGTQPVAAGSFTGGQQTIATNFTRNTWRESCLSFRYANTDVVAAGSYRGAARFTLAAP